MRERLLGRKFFSTGPSRDPLYDACRDTKWNPDYPKLIEDLWARFEPYCADSHFLGEARIHFHERTWEMYLACVLLERGFELVRSPPEGPDICIVEGGVRNWVEAVAVKSGDGEDRVPPRAARGTFRQSERGTTGWLGRPPSDESLILRYMSALDAKRRQFIKYKNAGIIADGEPCVVAVSFAQIEDADEACETRMGIPISVRSLFGLGPQVLEVPIDSQEEVTTAHHSQPNVTKRSGAQISTEPFCSDGWPEVSGVLCSCVAVANAPTRHGAEIFSVNNPLAAAPMRPGIFRFGTEYWADSEYLHPPQKHDSSRR